MLRHFYSPAGLEKQAKEGQQFFLAKENSKPVGFLGLSAISKKEWKLDKLYLIEKTRGKGYGRIMMNFALELARKNKADNLILNVNRFNESRNFYFGMGFRIREVVDIPLACFWLNDFIVEKSLR
jgi:GNAT superfamily N-acetyltransferase